MLLIILLGIFSQSLTFIFFSWIKGECCSYLQGVTLIFANYKHFFFKTNYSVLTTASPPFSSWSVRNMRHEWVVCTFEAWHSEGFIIPSGAFFLSPVHLVEVVESGASIRHAVKLLLQASLLLL